MNFKFLVFVSVLLVCEATNFEDRLYYRRAPLRFLFNNQGPRRPGNNWNYQVINGRPIISGFPNPNAYVAFGLNPQTGQIEQTQVIAQTRPGGPIINMIQNMLHVAGQFFGQLTGAFGNAVGGALQTAGQFGQDIQDITNPVLTVTGISQPVAEREPIQQPSGPGIVRPPAPPAIQPPSVPSIPMPSVPSVPSVPIPSVPSVPSIPSVPSVPSIPSPPSIETIPEISKSDIPSASSVLDQAIISMETLRTNMQANFQVAFETEEGESVLNKINEDINEAVKKLQELKDRAVTEANTVLQSGKIVINTAFDSIEVALEGVTGVSGIPGIEFFVPTRNELNKIFDNAIEIYQQNTPSVTSESEISPAF